MVIYKISDKATVEIAALPLPLEINSSELFIICRANEIHALIDIFGWDETATQECTNLDETVRYTSYDGYDFISLIYAEMKNDVVVQQEINLFFAKKHLVLVLPDNSGARLEQLVDRLCKAIKHIADRRPASLVYWYYLLLSKITADFSETLELLEDEIEALAEMIVAKPCHGQLAEIGKLRKMAYTYKKLLRASSYIGEQILVDENKLLSSGHKHYFRNIDVRLMKQYDFAEHLYDLSTDLLHTYDSKLSVQMNETVNKLTAITLIFGPLTVIAGIYGMNFTYMPELSWPWGYPFALGIMAMVGLTVFLTMKKKKWL